MFLSPPTAKPEGALTNQRVFEQLQCCRVILGTVLLSQISMGFCPGENWSSFEKSPWPLPSVMHIGGKIIIQISVCELSKTFALMLLVLHAMTRHNSVSVTLLSPAVFTCLQHPRGQARFHGAAWSPKLAKMLKDIVSFLTITSKIFWVCLSFILANGKRFLFDQSYPLLYEVSLHLLWTNAWQQSALERLCNCELLICQRLIQKGLHRTSVHDAFATG